MDIELRRDSKQNRHVDFTSPEQALSAYWSLGQVLGNGGGTMMNDIDPTLKELMGWWRRQAHQCNYKKVTCMWRQTWSVLQRDVKDSSWEFQEERLHKQGREVSTEQPSRDGLLGGREQVIWKRRVGLAMASSLWGWRVGWAQWKVKLEK